MDVEYVKEGSDYYLRVYADKEGGITINDCEIVNRALGDLLDKDDYIDDAYILEVSSPGLTRPLKKENDFKRSIGKLVEIKTFAKVNGAKEFEGILKAYDADTVTIEFEDETEIVVSLSSPRILLFITKVLRLISLTHLDMLISVVK